MRSCSHCHAEYGADERFCPHDGAPIVDERDADHPLVGRTLSGRYLVRRRIGQGGMGAVFEADHIGLDKRVAIKFLLDKFNADREVLMRFHREARTASKIGHENIVDITDIGETEQGEAYIVMELLTGHDLARLLRTTGPMDIARATHIIAQVCRGLAAAHEKGIVHRDMKPENVFLTQREDRADIVKIMDFGISKVIDAHDSKVRLTQTGAVVGTPIYMAPEQAMASHDVDHRADIYAVGVMFYELLCGRPPFVGTNYLQLATQHLQAEPPPPRSLRADISPELERLLLRTLAKRPADRPESMRELMRALPPTPLLTPSMLDQPQPVATGSSRGAGAYAAPTTAPTRAIRRASRAPVLLVAAAALAALGMVAFGYYSRGAERAAPVAGGAPPTRADAGIEPTPASTELTPAERGAIEIDSVPQGARVLFDGEPAGVTPLRLDEVAPGVHLVRLELEDHAPLEAQKRVRAGYDETFFGALAPTRSGRKSRVRTPRGESRPSPRPAERPTAERPTAERPTAERPTAERRPPTEQAPAAERLPGEQPAPGEQAPGDRDRKPNPYDRDRKPNPFADR